LVHAPGSSPYRSPHIDPDHALHLHCVVAPGLLFRTSSQPVDHMRITVLTRVT
jgi:hypothetical protein